VHGLEKKKIVKPAGVVVKWLKKRKGTRGRGLRAGVDCGHFLRGSLTLFFYIFYNSTRPLTIA
jgi:hypothetical protein